VSGASGRWSGETPPCAAERAKLPALVEEPSMNDVDAVLEQAALWLAEGRRVAWATVSETWRSSPRPPGSQMVIDDQGRFAGSVSGGCVEGAVIQHAAEVLASGQPQTRSFGVSSEQAWSVGLACGGKIEVNISESPRALVESIVAARARREPVAWLSDPKTGEHWLLEESAGPWATGAELEQAVRFARKRDESALIERAGRRLFLHVLPEPLRLLIVGAVHLAQELADLAQRCGFELTVIDPRSAFATKDRFPRATLRHDWPDEALEELKPDAQTAVVVLSHDAKLDEPALAAALKSQAFYVGALGSKKTQEARRRRLLEQGFSETDLARIHGPIGIDIGALSTAEIAVSIMAEIVRARRGTRR
jgi:xanthine dehydrogenase accessory factor